MHNLRGFPMQLAVYVGSPRVGLMRLCCCTMSAAARLPHIKGSGGPALSLPFADLRSLAFQTEISPASGSDPSRRERASATERLSPSWMETPDAEAWIEPDWEARHSRAPPPVQGELRRVTPQHSPKPPAELDK